MTTTKFIEESFSSRFKMTELLDDAGNLRYGLWEPPEIVLNGSEYVYTVPPEYEGRPDMLAFLFYGDENLWWVIAYVNNILLPMRDLVAGMQITIPSIDSINSALQRVRK